MLLLTTKSHSRDSSRCISGFSLLRVRSAAVVQTLLTVVTLSTATETHSMIWHTLLTLYTLTRVQTTGSVTRYGLSSVLLSSTTMYARTVMLPTARSSPADSPSKRLSKLSSTDGSTGSSPTSSGIRLTRTVTKLSIRFLQTSVGARSMRITMVRLMTGHSTRITSLLHGPAHTASLLTRTTTVRSQATATQTLVVYLHSVILLSAMRLLRM